MFDEDGNEFWPVEDQIAPDEFGPIFRSEVPDYEPTREDLEEMAKAFEAMDRDILERDEPDIDL